ncbi:MAG: hypothetical protein MUO40_04800, partial [Anaerolineaceae bacterium]|nr:hypothetical protein [Anaerolineaceae bacterium]
SSTQEPCFPMLVWVYASILPYEDPDPILVLPVYADSELGVLNTWVVGNRLIFHESTPIVNPDE